MDSVHVHVGLNGTKKTSKKSKTTVRTVVVSKTKHNRSRPNGPQRNRKRPSPFVMSQVNPFMTGVDGVRVPDSFSYPTGTALLRAATVIVNNSVFTTGSWVAFYPFADVWNIQPLSVTAGGTATWAGGSSNVMPQFSALTGAFSSYRTVASGLRITCEQALLGATGHIWVAHIPIDIDVDLYGYSYFPTTEAGIAALPLAEKYPLVELATKPLIVPFRRVDGSSYRYRDMSYPQSASPYAETNTGWCAILVMAVGMAGGSSAVEYSVENIQHVEALHKANNGSLIVPDTTIALPEPETLIAAETVGALQPVCHVETDQEVDDPNVWFDKVETYLNRGARLISGVAGAAYTAYSAYSSIVPSHKSRRANYMLMQ